MNSKVRIGLACVVASLTIYSAEAATPLTLGTTYAGAIAVPGQTNAFTFNGVLGQRLFFDSLVSDQLQIYVTLISPSGAQLSSRRHTDEGSPWMISEPGQYTLAISAIGSTTGAYGFRLLDLSTAPPLIFGSTTSDQLSPALACNMYQFNGKRGQRVSIQWGAFATNQIQWQLISPANAVLAQGQTYYQNLTPITLPMDGSYVVMLEPMAPGNSPVVYQFLASDLTDSPVATSGLGTAHAGTISANVTNSFTFTAPAGLPFYFDSLDASGQSLVVDLIDPKTNVVFTVAEITDSGPWVLPFSGTYTLNVRGPNGASGNYNFRLLDLTQSPALTLGTATTNTLATPYQTDFYQFTGNTGQRLYYDNLANSSVNVSVDLLGPDGQFPLSSIIYNDLGPVTLQASGTYYLRFRSGVASSTPYQFNLLDTGAQPALPLNTDMVGTLPANITRFFQLNGSAGQRLYFNGSANVGGASWGLLDPRNSYINSAGLGGDFELTLRYSGNYLLQLTGGSSPINYSNRVNTITYSTAALTLGVAVSNNIINPGDQLVYTFSGTAGQRIFYDGLGDYASINVYLYSPSGINVASGNSSYDFGPVTLRQTGTYTLVLDGNSRVIGPVAFNLLDVAAQPSLPLNADLIGSMPAQSAQLFTFSGTNGEALYFNGKYVSVGGAAWTLYGPNNLYVGSAGLGSDFEPRLPGTGTYVLALTSGSNPLTYSNQVNTYTIVTNTTALGTVFTNNLFQPGDQVYYTFTGAAGQRIYIDSLLSTYSSMNMSLFAPDGAYLGTMNASYDFGPLTLPISGTYYVQYDGNSDTIGPISAQILDIDSQPTLPLNTDLVGTLAPNVTQIYKLSGTPGHQLYFNAKGVVGGGAGWYLYGPNNAQLTGTSLAGDFEQTLAASGTYAVVFANAANPVAYSNQVNTFSYITNTLTLGATVTTALVHPGDQLYYTFSGSAGQRLYFDSRSTNYTGINVTIVSPAGATIMNANKYSDVGPFTLTQSGTYTMIFDGSGDVTDVLSFELLDLSSATPIAVGTPISDSLADQTQTKLYKFAGTKGQRLNLQSLSASGNGALWTLIGPSDQAIGTQPFVSANIGIVTLPVSGTYTLEVIGYGVVLAAVPYQLGITDVSDQPVAATGFGVVNSGNLSANQTNSYTYTGSAGTPVYFDSQDTSGQNLFIELIAPDGTTVFTVGETSDSSGPYTLPRSGTYTLNVRGYSGASGNYSFRLLDLSASPQLQLNTAVSGTLANPYETDVYQFTSGSGQMLAYDALAADTNFPSVLVNLQDPRGQSIGPGGDFQNDRTPFIVQYAGTCYFFLRNNKAVTSTYAFQMIDVAAQPVLPINAGVTNTLGVYQQLYYRYNGTAGQNLYFRSSSSNPSGYWTLYDPNAGGVSGGSSGLTGDFETIVPANGTYTLVLTSYASTPGTEAFLVNDYSYITNAYTLGTQVVDTISRPGERHVYTFTGTAGQHLFYDALTNDPPVGSIGITMFNPMGVQEGPFGGGRFSNDRGPFTLSLSGTYLLIIDGNNSATGTFAFQLLDVAAQPALAINAGVTNTMNAYPAQFYKFSGTAGQMLYFRGNPGNQSGYWQLFDENNNSLQSSGLTSDMEVTLPITGSYSLVLSSYGTAGPEIFQVSDYNYFTNSYTFGTVVNDFINRPGERHFYTFQGSAGQRLIYNALTNDPPSPNVILIQMINPDGAAEGPVGGRFTGNRGPFTLQESGTYTLVLDGSAAGVGPYSYQLLDVSSQPALPLSTSVTNALGAFPVIVYQYASIPGQHLYFRGLGSNPNGTWSLFDPNDSQLAGAGLISDFQSVSSVSGTYVLVIANNITTPGTEVFQVNPFDFTETLLVNRAPVLAHIPDPVLPAGVLVSFTAQATDADNNSLGFSLDPGSPAGAAINPTTGEFTWNPPVTGLSSVTPVTIRVTDNGTPPLSVAQVVNVEVIAGPAMISARPTNGVVNVSWHSAPGKHYQLQFKNEIYDATWQALGGTFTASDLISIQVDTSAITNTHRFYRAQSLDPLP
jgi:large repetitive protein